MLYIKTLGEFDIKNEGESILTDIKYPYRLVKLFKYLLTFHDRKLVPETIIGDLFVENDFQNPKAVLRTQISRLRSFLKSVSLEETFCISFSHGYYIFEINDEKCVMDLDIFEQRINNGNSLRDNDSLKAIESYLEAIKLYDGKYLSESEYEDWIIPLRNRYERLYLQSLFRVIELLDKNYQYEEIIEICEKALSLHPYNENLNIYFIESLLNMGENKYAFSHYEYITSKLYKELNIAPSDKMKKLYKKMSNSTTERDNIEIPYIDEKFKYDLKKEGAFQCDLDYFTFLYNLEKRRIIRDKDNKFLGIITILSSKYEEPPIMDFLQPMNKLINVISTSLRKGDVFATWNVKQIVFMLSNIEYKNLQIVKERIIKKFNIINDDQSFYLLIKIKPILNE